MKRIRKFLQLPSTDQRLLVMSAFLIGIIQIGLWLLPFQTVRRLLATMAQGTRVTNRVIVDRVVQAVSTAGRYLAATCLVQALVAQVLLARRGHQASLRIGVVKNGGGQLEAHAWIEYKETIIIGDLADLSRYTLLPSLPGESL